MNANPRVGIVGAGQLARMTAAPAAALGVDLTVLAADPGDSAAQVVRNVLVGSHDDLSALEGLSDSIITFDHEQVPPEHLSELQSRGVIVRPGPEALIYAQDKARMRQVLDQIGAPVPEWAIAQGAPDVDLFAQEHSWPVIVKASRGGYDGRGVWVVGSAEEAAALIGQTRLTSGAVWLVEQFLPFSAEIAVQVARSPHGQAVAYPVVETVQEQGMCARVIAPAPSLSDDQAVEATRLALKIAQELDVVGMLAVEMFVVDGRLVINELAMRPHNSGHWSIEGAVTSQFENHLRAVLDWPLGDPRLIAPHAVMVNIIGPDDPIPPLYEAYRHVLARDPQLHIHLYGKQPRPRRKLGHVTVVGDDLVDLLSRAQHAADYMMGIVDE